MKCVSVSIIFTSAMGTQRHGSSVYSSNARVNLAGARLPGKGYFVRPTVFSHVSNTMTVAREEIFGPVPSILPFRDEVDAIFQGNDTVYGLLGVAEETTPEQYRPLFEVNFFAAVEITRALLHKGSHAQPPETGALLRSRSRRPAEYLPGSPPSPPGTPRTTATRPIRQSGRSTSRCSPCR